jgi:hypothetical protein
MNQAPIELHARIVKIARQAVKRRARLRIPGWTAYDRSDGVPQGIRWQRSAYVVDASGPDRHVLAVNFHEQAILV